MVALRVEAGLLERDCIFSVCAHFPWENVVRVPQRSVTPRCRWLLDASLTHTPIGEPELVAAELGWVAGRAGGLCIGGSWASLPHCVPVLPATDKGVELSC